MTVVHGLHLSDCKVFGVGDHMDGRDSQAHG